MIHKFRAWLKYENKMADVIAIDFESKKVSYKIEDNFTDEEGEHTITGISYFKDIVLMQNTGLSVYNYGNLYDRDIVEMFGKKYVVCMNELGCTPFLVRNEGICWEDLENNILDVTGCNNTPTYTYNDNVISLWEIYWNFNCEENELYLGQNEDDEYNLKIIGNVYENTELLEDKSE